jgi:predicted dehydrogenase
MQLDNNILFNGEWDFTVAAELEKDVFEIIGEHGKISFPVFGNDITIEKNGKESVIHFDPPMHNQQNLIEQVVAYFLGNSENPCSAMDALQSMRVMEAFVYGANK